MIEIKSFFNRLNIFQTKEDHYLKIGSYKNLKGGNPIDYNLKITKDLETVAFQRKFRASIRASYRYDNQMILIELQTLPWLDLLAKIGGVMRSFAVLIVVVTLINYEMIKAKIIRGIFVIPSSEAGFFSRQKLKYKFNITEFAMYYLCCKFKKEEHL